MSIECKIYVEWLNMKGHRGISLLIAPEDQDATEEERSMWMLFNVMFEVAQDRISEQMADNMRYCLGQHLDASDKDKTRPLLERLRELGGMQRIAAIITVKSIPGCPFAMYFRSVSPFMEDHPLVKGCWATLKAALDAGTAIFEVLGFESFEADAELVAAGVHEAVDALPVFDRYIEPHADAEGGEAQE